MPLRLTSMSCIFAGGVNWTSNLAVSSLYGIQFMFDFDFDWTRIEASATRAGCRIAV